MRTRFSSKNTMQIKCKKQFYCLLTGWKSMFVNIFIFGICYSPSLDICLLHCLINILVKNNWQQAWALSMSPDPLHVLLQSIVFCLAVFEWKGACCVWTNFNFSSLSVCFVQAINIKQFQNCCFKNMLQVPNFHADQFALWTNEDSVCWPSWPDDLLFFSLGCHPVL